MNKLICILLCFVMLIFTACTNADHDMLKTTAKDHIKSYIDSMKISETIVSTEINIAEITQTDANSWLVAGTASITTTENSSPSALNFQTRAENTAENKYIFTDTEVYFSN